ncbi:MAG: peptide chain release factor N(5)-glutamine methyltransferase [Spirochaetales bacterium]|jgi:release factor glutamine methyltransferase|nr:peptide chain release factor N(5)-glutamine methyltransferase [Spirochaetales bacterium]
MTIARALRQGEEVLRAAGCDTPRLDALVLLAAGTHKDKSFLFAHDDEELSPDAQAAYEEMLARRLDGRPVSYILKCKEFYGLEFYVDERVLVPRPDTETLVDTALEILAADPKIVRIHDVCTGTGCVPIAITCNARAEREISASDISPEALEVFRVNCRAILGRELPHWQSDLLSHAGGPFDMITANPPYITREECGRMMARGWPEPEAALNGGIEGLDIIRRLLEEAEGALTANGWLVMEASPEQADTIKDMMQKRSWRDVRIVRDLAGRKRVTAGRKL